MSNSKIRNRNDNGIIEKSRKNVIIIHGEGSSGLSILSLFSLIRYDRTRRWWCDQYWQSTAVNAGLTHPLVFLVKTSLFIEIFSSSLISLIRCFHSDIWNVFSQKLSSQTLMDLIGQYIFLNLNIQNYIFSSVVLLAFMNYLQIGSRLIEILGRKWNSEFWLSRIFINNLNKYKFSVQSTQ